MHPASLKAAVLRPFSREGKSWIAGVRVLCLVSGLALLNFHRLSQHTVPSRSLQPACGTGSLSLAGAPCPISGDLGGLQVLSAYDSLPPPAWLQAGAVEVGEAGEEGAMSPYIPVRLKN